MPARSLSFTPPGRAATLSGVPVGRRHVFYLPGYDPDAERRYRSLFVRELARYAKRFAVTKRVSRAATAPDGLSQTWTVAVQGEEWSTTTLYEVLLWDDLVRADERRPVWASLGLLFAGMARMAADRSLFRVYRASPKFGNVMVYPFVTVLALGLVLAGVAAALAFAIDRAAGLPGWATVPIGLALGGALVAFAARRLDRFFFWQLLHDWNFNWRHAAGRRPDYEARLDRFAAQVRARAAEVGADEVMLVGHSTGAMTALEVAARALGDDSGLGTPERPVALVTLGSAMPLVAMQPGARRLRAEVAALVASERVAWVDYQAPQDWMNFPGFRPDRDLAPPASGPVMNPFVRSARYRDVMDPAAYRAILMHPFKMHFQFLMANDRPGEYDYFALTLGPQRLLDRLWRPLIARARPAAAGPETGAEPAEEV